MELKHIKTLDWSKEIQAIKEKYGNGFYRRKKAISAAAEFWGVKANDCGVIEAAHTEYVINKKPYEAEIRLAETRSRGWLIGLSASTPLTGFGWAPSVWDTRSYPTKHDARLAGVTALCAYFNRLAKDSPYKSKHNAINQVIAMLEGEKTPQLDLF